VEPIPQGLTLLQLYYVSLVLKHGAFDVAAEEAGVSQQTLYKARDHVRETLGLSLVQSDGGKIIPTPRARAFCEWLRPFMEELRGRIDALRRGESNSVLLVTTPPIIRHYGPTILRRFTAKYPTADLVFLDMGRSPEAAMLAVKHFEADIALMYRQSHMPGLTETVIGTCENVVVVGVDHPLAGRDQITIGELVQHPIVAYHRGTGVQRLVDAIFTDHEVGPRRIAEVGTSDAALDFALANDAFAVVHGATVLAHRQDRLRWYSLQMLPEEMRVPLVVVLYTRTKDELDPAVKYLQKDLVAWSREAMADIGKCVAAGCAGHIVEP
jgi:LysR family transcriptional regulator, low CO2-responsive transcriptional regulator